MIVVSRERPAPRARRCPFFEETLSMARLCCVDRDRASVMVARAQFEPGPGCLPCPAESLAGAGRGEAEGLEKHGAARVRFRRAAGRARPARGRSRGSRPREPLGPRPRNHARAPDNEVGGRREVLDEPSPPQVLRVLRGRAGPERGRSPRTTTTPSRSAATARASSASTPCGTTPVWETAPRPRSFWTRRTPAGASEPPPCSSRSPPTGPSTRGGPSS